LGGFGLGGFLSRCHCQLVVIVFFDEGDGLDGGSGGICWIGRIAKMFVVKKTGPFPVTVTANRSLSKRDDTNTRTPVASAVHE
jgi:hypothetical protein